MFDLHAAETIVSGFDKTSGHRVTDACVPAEEIRYFV